MVIHSKILFIPVASFAMLILAFTFSSSSMGLSLLSSLFNTNTHAASSASQFTVSLGEVLTMSAPDAINLTNCNPSTSTLCTASADITVSTNNLTGYSLYMNATNGSSTNLTNTVTTPNPTIPTLSESYSSANFPVNSWGYTGGTDQSAETGGYNCATNYCPILAYESSESSYAPNHIINATDAPAATSTTNLTFGAKADTSKASGTYSTSITFTAVANEVPTPTMQDFDSSACATATTDQTITLEDSRDGTEYTVAKLQDGNCWMTQNLELGTSGQSLDLTSATSNVPSNGYTLTLDTEQSSYKGNSNKYGNFYTFAQATAGSGSTTYGEDAPYDICPKNWRLPSASSTGATASEFYLMLNHYLDSSKWDSSIGYWSGLTTTEFTNPPVSLVFSGFWSSGSHSYQGRYGYWWSSTSKDSFYAFYLPATSDGAVNPRGSNGQTLGLTVRCLVPGA